MFDWRRPMWTANPLQKPWEELGFNEYEARHCCFGSDGGEDGGADDQDGGLTAEDTSGSVTGTDASTEADGQEMDDFDAYGEAYTDEHSASMGNESATEGEQGEEAGLTSVWDPETGKEYGQQRSEGFWGGMEVTDPTKSSWGGKVLDAFLSIFKTILVTKVPALAIPIGLYNISKAKTVGEAIPSIIGMGTMLPGNVGKAFSNVSAVLGAASAAKKGADFVTGDLLDKPDLMEPVNQMMAGVNRNLGLNTPNPAHMNIWGELGIRGPNDGSGQAPPPSSSGGTSTTGASDPFGGNYGSGDDSPDPEPIKRILAENVPTRTSTPLMTSSVSETMPLSMTSFGDPEGKRLPYGMTSPFSGVTDSLDGASIGSLYGSPRAGRMRAAA